MKFWTLLSPPLFDAQPAQEALMQRNKLRMKNMQNSNVLTVNPTFHDASGAFPINPDRRFSFSSPRLQRLAPLRGALPIEGYFPGLHPGLSTVDPPGQK
jgi:hypothetical protein